MKTRDIILSMQWTTKVLIRLRGCARADLRLCCSHMVKTGFLMPWRYYWLCFLLIFCFCLFTGEAPLRWLNAFWLLLNFDKLLQKRFFSCYVLHYLTTVCMLFFPSPFVWGGGWLLFSFTTFLFQTKQMNTQIPDRTPIPGWAETILKKVMNE